MNRFKPLDVEDAVEVPIAAEDLDPHEVILALVRSLDSKEAESILVESIQILATATGLKSQLDTLGFMKPTLLELDGEGTEELFAELEAELSNLADRDALILARFHEIVQEHKKANGTKTDI